MNYLDRAEAALVETASKVGPILSPVPTAYLVGRATIEHLAWPLPIGVTAALVIECLGLASTGLALELYAYNKGKRKSDQAAPFVLSVALVGVYFVTALALTVALDIATGLAVYAPALFPVLSLAGVSILAIRIDHRERLTAIERGKVERRKKRQEKTDTDRTPTEPVRRWPDKAAFLADPDRPDHLTADELAAMAGIAPRTARRWKAESRNGAQLRQQIEKEQQ